MVNIATIAAEHEWKLIFITVVFYVCASLQH